MTSGTVPIGSVVVRGTWERDDTARERSARQPMITIVEEQPVATTTRISRMPLWILSGQAGIVIATVVGFGARQNVKPRLLLVTARRSPRVASCCSGRLAEFSGSSSACRS